MTTDSIDVPAFDPNVQPDEIDGHGTAAVMGGAAFRGRPHEMFSAVRGMGRELWQDKAGFIGKFGTLLGDAGVNIANFNLGRAAAGADAIALVEVDGPVDNTVLAAITKLPLVKQAKALAF